MFKGFTLGFHEVKYLHGAYWLKVFHHDMSNGIGFFDESEAIHTETKEKYSILDEIDSQFKINNKFEFLLIYPEETEYNRWKQINNPLDEIEEGQSVAKGYESIHYGLQNNRWGGLVKTSQETSRYCLLNGTPSNITPGSFMFALGYRNGTVWSGKYTKLPAHTGARDYNEVYLWVRLPFRYSIFQKGNIFGSKSISILFIILFNYE